MVGGSYQFEHSAQEDRDNEMYRRDPVRREAEDHAAGVRSGGHLEDHAPAMRVRPRDELREAA